VTAFINHGLIVTFDWRWFLLPTFINLKRSSLKKICSPILLLQCSLPGFIAFGVAIARVCQVVHKAVRLVLMSCTDDAAVRVC
jgi:hypothetical protein